VDLDPAAATEAAELLDEEIGSGDREGLIAYRQGARRVARLVPLDELQEREETELQFPGDRAWRLEVSERGLLDNLRLRPAERKPPGPGELEIEVYAAGLNFRDVLNALDLYPGEAGPLGGECSGRVAAIGEGVKRFSVGDEVAAIASGSFAQFAMASELLTVHKPPRLSFEEAAAIPIAFLTAHYALRELGKLKAGERVLIHAAAGGVGLAAVRLAQRVGAQVYATASGGKWAFLKSLGVSRIMDSRSLDFADEVRNETGNEGVDLVLNSLTDDFIPQSLSLLKPEGRFLEIGRRGIWDREKVASFRKDISYFVISVEELCRENPGRAQAMLQGLMDEFAEGSLSLTNYQVFPIELAVEAFRFMSQAKQVGKIVLRIAGDPVAERKDTASKPREDGTYLITGGLGVIGSELGRKLVEQGARHLALIGRDTALETGHPWISESRAGGAQILTLRGDVSRKEDLESVLEVIKADMPPLVGVFHAAGVLDDGVLVRQRWERFEKVMAAKVEGAWNLHCLTRDLRLDWFVCFSSLASLLGSPGQANYAAGNAFLDALCHHRRLQGMAGLSINWGPWAELGMSATRRDRPAGAVRGIAPLKPARALEVLEALLGRAAAPQVGVLPVDWPTFLGQFAGGAPSLFLEVGYGKAAQAARPRILAGLEKLAPGKRRRALLTHVQQQVARITGDVSSRPIDSGRPLRDLGFDSLMAVELRNALRESLDRDLPPTLLFEYPTIEAITDYLAGEALKLDGEEKEPTPALPADGEMSSWLERIEKATEEEVASMLAEELSSLEERKTRDKTR